MEYSYLLVNTNIASVYAEGSLFLLWVVTKVSSKPSAFISFVIALTFSVQIGNHFYSKKTNIKITPFRFRKFTQKGVTHLKYSVVNLSFFDIF